MIPSTMNVRSDTTTRVSRRRRALALLAAATGGALARPLRGLTASEVGSREAIDSPHLTDPLERFRRAVDGDTIRRLAEDYLDTTSDPADADWLVARVLEHAHPAEDVGAYMRRRIAADYESHRTHDFRGWLVSKTEARLLAALALTAQEAAAPYRRSLRRRGAESRGALGAPG